MRHPFFVTTTPGTGSIMTLYGLITDYIISPPIQDGVKRPLLVLDCGLSFVKFASVFSDQCEFIDATEIVKNKETIEFKKTITIVDTENIRPLLDLTDETLDRLKVALLEHKPTVLISEAGRFPKDFLSWISAQTDIKILGVASMRPTDISDCWSKQLVHFNSCFIDTKNTVFTHLPAS